MTENRTLVLIPARMAATRLPGQAALDIGGVPMIVHVLRRAEAAQIGRVAVATDTPEIASVVKAHGGLAVMTSPDHPSGSDRIYEAMKTLDPEGNAEIVVNLQGDFPTITPDTIRAVLPLVAPRSISRRWRPRSTPGRKTSRRACMAGRFADRPAAAARAVFHARHGALGRGAALPSHRPLRLSPRAALERFVQLPPSALEKQENLEQLRALEAGMRIDVTIVDTVPRGVDTPADLETARQLLAKA